MNRRARYELAEGAFASRHAHPPARRVRGSTTSPFDLRVLLPRGDQPLATFLEVETPRGRCSSDLSEAEAEFGRFAPTHGCPYVIARYRVVSDSVSTEELHRPLIWPAARPPDVELRFEVSK